MQSMWRVLARFDDPGLASAVATTIAAMEFEVRLEQPSVVEVMEDDQADLAEVLDEIVAEQQEFDRLLEEKRNRAERSGVLILLILSGTADAMILLSMLDR